MAPECLRRKVFLSKSDVWSFGVVLWECFTFGDTPYAGISNAEYLDHVAEKGHRLHIPRMCPPELYLIMRKCWEVVVDNRPSFSDLSSSIAALLSSAPSIVIENMSEYHDLPRSASGDLGPASADSNSMVGRIAQFATNARQRLGSIVAATMHGTQSSGGDRHRPALLHPEYTEFVSLHGGAPRRSTDQGTMHVNPLTINVTAGDGDGGNDYQLDAHGTMLSVPLGGGGGLSINLDKARPPSPSRTLRPDGYDQYPGDPTDTLNVHVGTHLRKGSESGCSYVNDDFVFSTAAESQLGKQMEQLALVEEPLALKQKAGYDVLPQHSRMSTMSLSEKRASCEAYDNYGEEEL
eukprot:Opistho-2@35378